MNTWITIGALTDIPQRGARVVRTEDGDIAVFRTGRDHLFAVRDSCPHRGGPLSEGIVFGERVACPLHNWSIDLSTGEAVAPDHGCVQRYPVRRVGDEVQISLQALISGRH